MGWNDHIDDPPEKRRVCPVCGGVFMQTYLHEPDVPGNRWPERRVPLMYPCGHDSGKTFDEAHGNYYFRKVVEMPEGAAPLPEGWPGDE